MRIHVYCICRNEERILPYFLRHYETLADAIYFFDDQSTDRTMELIKSSPISHYEVWPGSHGIVDDEFKEFAEQKYKRDRGVADWIIWADADELIYHPQIRALLEQYLAQGVEVPKVRGFGMVGKKFPTTKGQIYEELTTGYDAPVYAKPVVFQSRVDMRWHHGKHMLAEGFSPKQSEVAELKLLHYRWLEPEYVQGRNLNNWNRLDQRHRDGGYGWTCNPTWHGESSYDWYMAITPNQLFANVLTVTPNERIT